MSRVLNAIKQFKFRDLLAPFIFLTIFIPSLVFRLINRIKGRKLWLVAEQGEARDNGYHFYKYVREKHPQDFCFYAIKPESAGYNKVAKLGNVIEYGSLKHWLYYMSANLNVSSQKSGNPAPIFWYVVHVMLGLYKNRVFLQHGVTHNDAKWIYYDKTKFKYFVCATRDEYSFIFKNFGYPEKNLLLAGFSRWDNLKDTSKKQKNKSILIMPTWRNWLGGEKNKLFTIKDFLNTDYYKKWSAFLNDTEFVRLIEKNHIDVYFYPHINMQAFLKSFKASSKNVKIISYENDIQEYFNKCDTMITDYSSVAFDFAYLQKPVIYYQFDKEEYRDKQYAEGYFNYMRDGFGEVVDEENALVGVIRTYTQNGYKIKSEYKKRIDNFFTKRDRKNSQRIYRELTLLEGF